MVVLVTGLMLKKLMGQRLGWEATKVYFTNSRAQSKEQATMFVITNAKLKFEGNYKD